LKIGTGIVLWLEKVAITAGIALLFVQVRDRNRVAAEFYKALGFVAIDEAPGYYRGMETGLIMSKSLRPLPGTA
jgi:ribosomal protein S18 acetylase RimI-like enzyme